MMKMKTNIFVAIEFLFVFRWFSLPDDDLRRSY